MTSTGPGERLATATPAPVTATAAETERDVPIAPSGPAPAGPAPGGAERARMAQPGKGWRRWGPYLSERAWGTVREDYSEDGDCWANFPHEQARSRAYRWSEDGLGGICDDHQFLCLAFAFWNGQDPVLKERIFGLTGPQGNHGEDAKEYWWYLDATPTASYLRWRYLYPQRAFPYEDLVQTNATRSKQEPEYELVDTGVLDEDRYFDITAEYAKGGPDDVCIRLSVRNAGPEAAELDVLPTMWFRNTWAWGHNDLKPSLKVRDGALVAQHSVLPTMTLAGDGEPELLVCENESNSEFLWGVKGPAFPKDGINDHVLTGAATVNPEGVGTKGALRYHLCIEAHATAEIRLRFSKGAKGLGNGWAKVLATRAEEADEFHEALAKKGLTAEERLVVRQALSGMLWSKQYYHYNVAHWLDGDPSGPPVPPGRGEIRNGDWRHLDSVDVLSMPDKWEYPWFAAWDLAFHCVTLAHVDSQFAKAQLILICREWFMHPNGQLAAYEWNFSDVNPPVQAWAALRVFEIDGSRDHDFLRRVFSKLLLNFTWWVNRKDAAGNNVFEGGFLGLDNIGPIDRSKRLPEGGRLEQSDGTAWMAMFCLNMWEISLVLASEDEAYEDMATKFFEHFCYIGTAMYDQRLWNDEDGFYYDVLQLAGAAEKPLRVRSLVGLLPLCATTTLSPATLRALPAFAERLAWFLANKPELTAQVAHDHAPQGRSGKLFSIVDPERLRRVLQVMCSESEFLSPHGLRSVAASHREHPFELDVDGLHASVDYEPGESASGLFGGNSNWRGPVWFPINYLIIESLRRFHRFLGPGFKVEYPTGSGTPHTLGDIADDLSRRLVSIFLDDESGRRPVFGAVERFQTDRNLHDLLFFHEYFHGDDGHGLGASHQTGWTGLVANLLLGD